MTTLAVTLGDPAGIGPELVLKTIAQREKFAGVTLHVIGTKSVLRAHAKHLAIPFDASFLEDGTTSHAGLKIEDLPLAGGSFEFGQNSAACGKASYDYLVRAVTLAKEKRIDAMVTGPIQKESWDAAQVPYIGHTEALAEHFKSHTETVFVVDKLRIFFLTRHVSLRKALDLITKDRIVSAFTHAHESLKWFGITNPRIAIAGLNPHAGNSGLFGDEEIKILAPAVAVARQQGILAFGPLPGDSVFHQCAEGEFDGVISLYHDQGHIAAKMKSFLGTVAVTTGLPVLRTSVDHGTAFDIAGKNRADPTSMIAAVQLAAQLVQGQSAISVVSGSPR